MRLIALLLASSSVFAQTAAPKPATTAAKTPVHRTTTSTPPALQGANAPGIPKVTGIPKTLYTLRYVDTLVGTGDLAVPRKWYTVHYTGYLTNGTKFDSSVDRGQPFTFPYGARRVIAGWDTGFEGMRVGGKRRLIVPYQLAYGEVANEKIPAKSTLIFDVELLGMSDTPPAPPAGAAPPARPATPPPATSPQPTTPPTGGAPAETTKPATPSTPIDPSKPTPPATTNQAPDPAKLPGAPPNGV